MEKVVQHGCKVDFHIHSVNSKHLDGNKVASLTLDNINVLINKLNENDVNICSFSDHNRFSLDYYKRLKEEEGNEGSIKKVLPAVEFSVGFGDNPQKGGIHIITVFDDEDEDKLKILEGLLDPNSKTYRKFDGDDCYTESTYVSILSKVGLDCICIAHQKQTLTSNNEPSKRDANYYGEDKFKEFVLVEYFETYEFKNRKNEIYNNQSIQKFNMKSEDLLRFTTGSDCHDWNLYPYSSEDEKGRDLFRLTYLKCLPNFKGVALALTDNSRISLCDNFFSESDCFLDKLQIKLRGETIDIPLSRGINVIIGENSIGKSLLLHKLTGNQFIPEANGGKNAKSLNDGYNEFAQKNEIEVISRLGKTDILKFDTQGSIRNKFLDNKLGFDKIFENKFPNDLSIENIRISLTDKLNSFCDNLETKFAFDEKKANLTTFPISPSLKPSTTELILINANSNQFDADQKNVTSVLDALKVSSSKLENILNDKMKIDDDDKKEITDLVSRIKKLIKKYETKSKTIAKKKFILDKINATLSRLSEDFKTYKTSEEKKYENYIIYKNSFTKNVSAAYKEYVKIKPIDFSINITDKLFSIRSAHSLYNFVVKTSVDKIDDNYFKELLLSPIKEGAKSIFDNIYNITNESFYSALSTFHTGNDNNAVEIFKSVINKRIESDLQISYRVVKNKDDFNKEYSSGTNVQIYFDVYSSENEEKGIYIIDQPEDDVSPKAIKEYLLDDFRKMRQNRQIILVTHNPQFVVNLDADNVIYMFYNEDDNNLLDLRSGALEYYDKTDKNSNILDAVANTLDGGVDSIRKRWKCYGKKDYNF